jgi:CheY-like chemotaxis protein
MRPDDHHPRARPPSRVTVLIADDDPAFRATAQAVVAATPGFVAVGEAAAGAEAVMLAERTRPDLVLMDVRMPGMDGIEAAHRIASVSPWTAVVFVSADGEDAVPESARPAATVAVLAKEDVRPARLRSVWQWRRTPRHVPGPASA